MNVAYNEISASDAARMIGVDYSTVVAWCREGRVNCVNVSGGTKNGRYSLSEDEVLYIKTLKQKFGKQFIRRYRRDWKKGRMPKQEELNMNSQPITTVKSVVMDISEEKPVKEKLDIDEIAIKIGMVQDIKEKIDNLEAEKIQLTNELEKLRKEILEYL